MSGLAEKQSIKLECPELVPRRQCRALAVSEHGFSCHTPSVHLIPTLPQGPQSRLTKQCRAQRISFGLATSTTYLCFFGACFLSSACRHSSPTIRLHRGGERGAYSHPFLLPAFARCFAKASKLQNRVHQHAFICVCSVYRCARKLCFVVWWVWSFSMVWGGYSVVRWMGPLAPGGGFLCGVAGTAKGSRDDAGKEVTDNEVPALVKIY